MSDKTSMSGSAGCGGCLGCVVFVLLAWALLFGITIGGIHYGISCSTERGVEIAP